MNKSIFYTIFLLTTISMAKDIDDLKAIVEKLMKENEELKASINK